VYLYRGELVNEKLAQTLGAAATPLARALEGEAGL
jgi:hypothetical protein